MCRLAQKGVIFFLIVLFLCFGSSLSLPASANNSSEIVFITDTGYAYHCDGCSYLKSRRAVTLQYAAEHGYSPCSRCHPPIPDFSYTVIEAQKKRTGSSGPSSSFPPRSVTSSRTPSSSDTDREFFPSPEVMIIEFVSVPASAFALCGISRAVSARKKRIRTNRR